MAAHLEHPTEGVTTRAAAALTGVSRATLTRATKTPTSDPAPRSVAPANKLSLAERTQMLAVLNSAEFVDQRPLQVYATRRPTSTDA